MMKAATSAWTTLQICSDTILQMAKSYLPKSNVSALKTEWAERVLSRIGLQLEIIGQPVDGKSVLFVGNHLSYLDIPLLMQSVPGISFVAKKEISRWPIFGYGAHLLETVFVDRNNGPQRTQARETIGRELEFGKRIALFPSGTTCLDESVEWRRGAFEIAKKHAAFIQPFRIQYHPLRLAAFIDDDVLATHLLKIAGRNPIRATIEFHAPVEVSDAEESRQTWQKWARPSSYLKEEKISEI